MTGALARIDPCRFLVFVETSDLTRRYVSICDTKDPDLLATVLHKPDALPFDLAGARAVVRRLVNEWVDHRRSRRYVRTLGIEVATQWTWCRCPGCLRRRREKAKPPRLSPGRPHARSTEDD